MRKDEIDPGTGEVHSHVGVGPRRAPHRRTSATAERDIRRESTPLDSPDSHDGEGVLGQARLSASRLLERVSHAIEARTGAISLARENPFLAIGLSMGVGFLLAGSNDSESRMGQRRSRIRGALTAAIAAAAAEEARDFLASQGGPEGLLSGLLGMRQDDEDDEDEDDYEDDEDEGGEEDYEDEDDYEDEEEPD